MRVLCTLPHCSSPINGWSFAPTPNGWVSEDLPAEVAQYFLTIPGYARWEGPAEALAPPPSATEDDTTPLPPSELPRPVSRRSRSPRTPV